MQLRTTLLLPLLALAPAVSAAAQVSTETFLNGNPDAWEIWFTNYNTLRSNGGNPGVYLELDNFTSGPLTCQFLDIRPDRLNGAVTLSHAGNWRAAGVGQVALDVNVQQGRYDGILTVLLVSDPGTPSVPGDDCVLRLSQTAPGPSTAGWNTFTFPVPAAQTTIPAGWSVDPNSIGCTGGTLDQTWNTVIQDVDELWFRYDTLPGFCTFTRWIYGIDNVTVAPANPTPPGTNYCTAAANSTGVPAAMSATGSASVAANVLTLRASSMPVQTFGFFLTSATQGFVANPGGSQGNLCLGGGIGRYVAPGQIKNSGATGSFHLVVNLDLHPSPGGFVQVQPGQTWHFTCWYRDVVGGSATSNFADGYTVVFL